MHIRAKAAAIALFAALIPLEEARSAPVLDQEYVAAGTNTLVISSNQPLAQSFTVGLDGVLDSVEVQVFRTDTSTTGTVTLSILEVTGGVLGSVLTSVTRPVTDLATAAAFLLFDLADLDVDAGDTLAIRMVSDTPGGGNCTPACWVGDFPGLFADGTGYVFDQPNVRDFGFRTFIDADIDAVPEPSALGLIVAALAGLGFAARRRTRI